MYRHKKDRERAWHEPGDRGRTELVRPWLHHPVVLDYGRLRFNRVFPRMEMAAVAERHTSGAVDKLLIAACGRGAGFGYVQHLCRAVDGVDLATTALRHCPQEMRVAATDALRLHYADNAFDLIVSSLFSITSRPLTFVPSWRSSIGR